MAGGITSVLMHPHTKNEANAEIATQRGTYIHKALAEMTQTPALVIPDWIDRCSEPFASIYRIRSWLISEMITPLATEYPVAYKDENNRTLFTGRIDLLGQVEGTTYRVLIDYKTEERSPYEKAQQKQIDDWSTQLSAYWHALPEDMKPHALIVLHAPRQSHFKAVPIKLKPIDEIKTKLIRPVS